MQPRHGIPRGLAAFAAVALAAWAFTGTASAQPQPGDVLVIDNDVPPVSTAVLFQVDAQTGARTVLSSFGGSSPSAVAVESDGGILVTDTDAGTDPAGGTSEWGALYRLTPNPVTGELVRTTLTDFGMGASAGRTPRAVAVERDGHILAINASGGTGNRAVLVRIDPVTGARAVLSDFGDGGQGGLGVEPRGLALEASGQILVIDAQAGFGGSGSAQGELVRIDPQTGMRTSVSNFGQGANPGSNPTAVAVEANGQVLVTDEGHPSTAPLGLLYRVDPQSGARAVLSDLNTGANTGREPEGVAVEASGQILVIDKHAGPFTRGMLLRIDPQTGERTVASDFGAGANQGGDPLALAIVPQRATLMVITEIVRDNGGPAPFDATITMRGQNPVPASFPGVAAPGTAVGLDPGGYGMTFTIAPQYSVAFSSGCSGIIAAGETKTCTITADDIPASVFVIERVVNDDGGSAIAGDFAITVTGIDPSPASFPGEAAGTFVQLDVGSYSVSVSGPPGYTSTLSQGCAGTLGYAEGQICRITSDDDPPPSTPTCDGKAPTIVGGAAATEIRGTLGNDVIIDLDGDNVIRSRGGDDTICTGPGNDGVLAGDGADTVIDTGGQNAVEGGAGNDVIQTAAGDDSLDAGGGADTLTDAGGRSNTVNGGAANDAITTGAGNDAIQAGGGDDTVDAGDGDNTVNGQAGNDGITAGSGDDAIDGAGGFDTCAPGAGLNTTRRCERIL